MSAPAPVGAPTPRTRTPRTERKLGERKLERGPEPTSTRATRGRTTAAQRAYARKASRKQRWLGSMPERLPKLTPRTPFVLLVMALLATGVLVTLFLSLSAVSDSYKLEDLRKKTTDLTSKVEQLKADVANGQSPQALYDQAKKLGMVPAPDPARIKVNPDGSVTVVGTPVPATTTPPPPPPSSSTPPPSSPAGSSSTSQPPASGGGH